MVRHLICNQAIGGSNPSAAPLSFRSEGFNDRCLVAASWLRTVWTWFAPQRLNLLFLRIRDLTERGSSPHLAVVIVGDDPASHVYVRSKERACERLGIRSTRIDLPAAASFDKVLATVESLNQDPDVDGILVQSPLPRGMDELAITDHILPEKDVDGFHPVNLGRLVQGRLDGLLPSRWRRIPQICRIRSHWSEGSVLGVHVL